MLKPVRVNRSCSYCAKHETQVRYLIEGRGSYICEECVKTCGDLLLERASRAQPEGEAGVILERVARHAYEALRRHFQGLRPDEIVTATRVFPARMRADVQRSLEQHLGNDGAAFCGLHARFSFETVSFAALLQDQGEPVAIAPAGYEEVDIGEDEPVRCLENGLWLLEEEGCRYALYLTAQLERGSKTGVRLEIAVPAGEPGAHITRGLFTTVEQALKQARSYRGKVLSLETDSGYTGQAVGVRVHRLEPVARDSVILPARTLELLDRTLIQFAHARPALARIGMPVKKGLLFYGPPGTGKTYTIRYLASALPDHTMLLVTAEEVGLLKEYVALARLLEPSIVVIEDADLIARDRTRMDSPCEEALLNRLLNEMDGLRQDAQIVFILTTNRPETIEPAISNRPGRIDQAIEFPLPDADARRRLAQVYACGMEVSGELLDRISQRTERCSPAFIKELMRRTAQYYVESGARGAVPAQCVDPALEEMLFAGGKLNVRLLGGDTSEV